MPRSNAAALAARTRSRDRPLLVPKRTSSSPLRARGVPTPAARSHWCRVQLSFRAGAVWYRVPALGRNFLVAGPAGPGNGISPAFSFDPVEALRPSGPRWLVWWTQLALQYAPTAEAGADTEHWTDLFRGRWCTYASGGRTAEGAARLSVGGTWRVFCSTPEIEPCRLRSQVDVE